MNRSQRRKQSAGNRHPILPGAPSTPFAGGVVRGAGSAIAAARDRVPLESIQESEANIPTLLRRIGKYITDGAVLLLLPLVVLSAQINPIFTPPGGIDPWVYLGFFRSFANFEGVLFPGTYYGSRLSWVLPGYLLHHVFPPVTATVVLHLSVYLVALFSFYYTISATIGRRTALLSSIVFGLYPYFWSAIGWDYVDGAGIAYYLLTMALLTKAASTRNSGRFLAAAGAGMAGLVYSNLAWVFLTPALVIHYLALRRNAGFPAWRSGIVNAALWGATGALVVTLILSVINHSVAKTYWFYRPSVMFGLQIVRQRNPWYQPPYADGLPLPWLWFPILTLAIGLIACARLLIPSMAWTSRAGRTTLLFVLELLLVAGVFIYLQTHGSPWLGTSFYASYMIPMVFLGAAPVFWVAAERLGRLWFALAAAATLVLLGGSWWVPQTSRLIEWSRPGKLVFVLAAAGALVSAMLLQKHRYALLLSAVGFGLLNVSVSLGRPADTDSSKRAYQRVMNARAVVEEVRGSQPIRWWYNETERGAADFTAVSSTYLWGYTLIGSHFPELKQKPVIEPPCILAVISGRPDTAEAARLALYEPLKEQGLSTRLERVSVIQDQTARYTLALMRIEKPTAVLERDKRGDLAATR